MPDPTTLRPPDMVGAGAYGQPQDPASLIGLLRSQGSLPAEAMMSMMGPQPFPQPFPHPSASPLASALLGGVAMMPGQTGAQQAVQMNQQQQMQQTYLMQRVQEQRQQAIERQQDAFRTLGLDFLKMDSPAARRIGVDTLARYAKSVGIPWDPAIAQELAQGSLSPSKMDEIRTRLKLGTDPLTLAKMYNVSPTVIASVARMPENPATNRLFGLQTPDEQKKSALDLQDKSLTVWAKEHGIDRSSDIYSEMTRRAQKPIDQMTDSELQALRADAEVAVRERGIQDKLRVVKAEADIQHKDRMAEIAERERLRQTEARNNPLFKKDVRLLQAQAQGFPVLEQREQRVKAAVDLLQSEGLLTEGGTLVEWLKVQALAQTKINRPDIAAALNTLQRFGVPLIVNAEKELAGQPIGSMLRLKSVVEAEVGGILRVPALWWKDFFEDYDLGLKNQRALVKDQLDAMGVPLPEASPLTPSGGPQQEYNALRAGGMSPEAARAELKKRGYAINE